jgi:hypothetical protein
MNGEVPVVLKQLVGRSSRRSGAGPVTGSCGKRDLGTAELPAIETALIDGDVAFRQHGAHRRSELADIS